MSDSSKIMSGQTPMMDAGICVTKGLPVSTGSYKMQSGQTPLLDIGACVTKGLAVATGSTKIQSGQTPLIDFVPLIFKGLGEYIEHSVQTAQTPSVDIEIASSMQATVQLFEFSNGKFNSLASKEINVPQSLINKSSISCDVIDNGSSVVIKVCFINRANGNKWCLEFNTDKLVGKGGGIGLYTDCEAETGVYIDNVTIEYKKE